MNPTFSLRQTLNNADAIRKAVAALTENDVLIGVPAEQAGGREGGVNNAELSYIHEFGAPAAGIPARPHLLPAMNDIAPEAATLLKEAGAVALKGGADAVERGLARIGLLGQNAVRGRFQDNDWPPLKDATLDRKPLKKDDGAMFSPTGRARHCASRPAGKGGGSIPSSTRGSF